MTQKRLACLFYLHNRRMYADCLKSNLRHISDLKQHLTRAHLQTVHCPRCGTPFPPGIPGFQDWTLHQRNQSCPKRSFDPFPGVSQEQLLKITHITNDGSLSQDDKWRHSWHVIFPDSIEGLPKSPWLPHFTNSSELRLQYLMDSRNDFIEKVRLHVFQPQWNTPPMVSASDDQRQGIILDVLDRLIEHEMANICREPCQGRRENGPGFPLLFPAPNPRPPQLTQSAQDGPASPSTSNSQATAGVSPMFPGPRPSLMQPTSYEQHGVMGDNLYPLMQASSGPSWSQQTFSETAAISSGTYAQGFPFPLQGEPVYLSGYVGGVINDSVSTVPEHHQHQIHERAGSGGVAGILPLTNQPATVIGVDWEGDY